MTDPLSTARNFARVFAFRGEERPDAVAFRALGATEAELTYGDLDRAARRIAAALAAVARPGDRALLLFEPGLAFVEAFAACHYARVVPVPMFPPDVRRLDQALAGLDAIARSADPAVILCSGMIDGLLRPGLSAAPAFAGIPWLCTDAVEAAPADIGPALDAAPDELALLQFTSGSTGTPRGVMVSHANLLHNERAIRRAFGHDRNPCRGVGWLPTYHDMGLIGNVLQTVYMGGSTVLMSPMDFIQRPHAWLRAISAHRGTTCGGPNFAYDLCTRRVTEAQMQGLDLSSWRVAFCGAEPIHRPTLDRFADRFAAVGFDRAALYPCYGLAEATLMVSGGWLDASAPTRWLREEAVERGRAEPAAPETLGSRAHVTCGPPVEGQRVAIVDPETRRAADPGGIGEIWVAGPSVAAGYWRAPEASAEAFAARLADAPEQETWLRTGDLGALIDGRLVVTGRLKDLLILHGRNLYPQDVEATVRRAAPGISPGAIAAVALPVDGEERLGLVVGLRGGAPAEVEAAIRRAVSEAHGVAIHRLALVDAQTVPRTSSGKIQRSACRALLTGRATPTVSEGEAASYATAAVQRLEGRNTRYRFDIEADVAWDRVDEPGVYFPPEVLAPAGVDEAALARVPGLADTFQWALAVAICEEFVALERRIIRFLRDERAAGRLPDSRSADLFDEEEVKHVALFRRYADHLKAQRPAIAAELDRHLGRAFAGAWWADDRLEAWPSVEVYHFVNWLHFVYFEEYSIELCQALQRAPGTQPAWLTAHIAHMNEERQHVATDVAHLTDLALDEASRREWSRWFLEQSAEDASGLAGLDGVWSFVVEQCPDAAALPQPQALIGNVALKRRAFLRLITRERAFTRTLKFSPGFADFEAALKRPLSPSESGAAAPASESERHIRDHLADAVAQALGLEAAQINVTQPLMHFGLDSVAAVEIAGDLEALVGRPLPPTILFEHPTIAALAAALATGEAAARPAPAEVPEAIDRGDDLLLDLSIFEAEAPSQRAVFVTGATGFLCGFALADLLRTTADRAICLVRAADPAEAMARIRDNLSRYGVWQPAFAARITAVPGDLERSRFGLSDKDFAALAAEVDAILHGGAIVDFVQPYERLRAANVQGTHEVIRLAFLAGRVPLDFVSTIAIFDTRDQDGERRFAEADGPADDAGFRNGYAESKWIAERLVTQAGERGLPYRVFRPGVVSGDTRRGAWQVDLAATLLRSYARRGAAIAPTHDGAFDAAPVDYVARAMVHLARDPRTLGGVFHLTNPRPTPWREIYAAMGRLGHPVQQQPYDRWLDGIAHEPGGELRPFLGYFRARREAWQIRQPRIDCRRTQAALAGSGITCPPLDDALLRLYLDALLDPRSGARDPG